MGQIYIPYFPGSPEGSSCSATAINPRVVVTARHCFCNKFELTPALVQFTLPGMGEGVSIPGERIVAHTGGLDVCAYSIKDTNVAAGDLAVVVLSESIPPDIVSTFMQVDFSPDVFTLPLFDPELKIFQTGFGGINWDSDFGSGHRRTGPVLFYYPSDTSDGWPNAFFGSFYVATANATEQESGENSTHAKGDSGGALWMARVKDGLFSERRLVGVVSGHYSHTTPYWTPIIFWEMEYWQTWAPTWNVGFNDHNQFSSNGLLILDALGDDADNDGIQDDVDNCPPSFCKYDPMACANTLQEDSDHDGYGDACDTCPEKDFYVPGKPPPDRDNDGVQDSCDTCPAFANKWSQADSEGNGVGDGVGDACDNCPGTDNPTKSCASDADCPKPQGGGDNFCVLPAHRCAAQLDDADNDGLGDSCDACSLNDQNGLRQIYDNSNVTAELRWNAPELLDVCDPVPVYVSRPVAQPPSTLCPTDSDASEKCSDSLPFETKAVLGTEKHTQASPTTTSFKAVTTPPH